MKKKVVVKVKSYNDFTANRKRVLGPSNPARGLIERSLDRVTVKSEISTHRRKYRCGETDDSIKTLRITIDLSKSKHPWQPHEDQAEEFAESVSAMLVDMYSSYLSNF